MKGFETSLAGYVTSAHTRMALGALIRPFQHASPAFNFTISRPMTQARKPIEIIAAELWDHDDPETAAEDVVEALEAAGWRLVWVPDEQGGEGAAEA